MTSVPHTHVLRQKTGGGFSLTTGFYVEGLGFMMMSPLRGNHMEETGRYRILRDVSGHEIVTCEEARARGWLSDRMTRHRLQFEHAAVAV